MFDRTGVVADGSFPGIGIFDLFGSRDLDLDPTTFIYEHDPRYEPCANMNFLRQ